jgi:hypothetical protein
MFDCPGANGSLFEPNLHSGKISSFLCPEEYGLQYGVVSANFYSMEQQP